MLSESKAKCFTQARHLSLCQKGIALIPFLILGHGQMLAGFSVETTLKAGAQVELMPFPTEILKFDF
jgi:hypothetical protein